MPTSPSSLETFLCQFEGVVLAALSEYAKGLRQSARTAETADFTGSNLIDDDERPTVVAILDEQAESAEQAAASLRDLSLSLRAIPPDQP